MVSPTIDQLAVADPPAAWSAAGFAVESDSLAVGGIRIRLAGPDPGSGLAGWSLRGLVRPSSTACRPSTPTARHQRDAPTHPNGVTGIDHVVAITPALERTVAALERAGLDLRRIREQPTPAGAPRQAFFRLGPTAARGRPGAVRGNRARRRHRPPRLLLGPGLPRPRPRSHRRLSGRPGQRDPPRRPARPPNRHPAPLRRPLRPRCPDHAATRRGERVTAESQPPRRFPADAESWFRVFQLEPGVHLIGEPGHVNSWLIEGGERAVLLDTGMGLADISAAVTAVCAEEPLVVNSHVHFDHVGGNQLFAEVAMHRAGPEWIEAGCEPGQLSAYPGWCPRWRPLTVGCSPPTAPSSS